MPRGLVDGKGKQLSRACEEDCRGGEELCGCYCELSPSLGHLPIQNSAQGSWARVTERDGL